MEIRFNNVSYDNEKQIFKKINLCFKNNTINSVIGDNKELLIKMLLGQLPIDGSITIDDIDINAKNFQRDIGFISIINTKQTVQELIYSNLEKYNYKKDEKHLKDSLKMVGLDNTYLNSKVSDLSSGEQKRVFIASILAYNPKIIIFDENILQLDANGKNNLIKIIRLLKNRFHKTVIILSNDMNLIHKLSDYIYIINKGSIIKEGTKYEIFTDIDFLKKHHINIPDVIRFSNLVLKEKKVKMGYRDEINDLLKDIYRYAK